MIIQGFYFVRVQLIFYTLQELESEEQRGKIAELEQTLKDRDEQEWKSGESTVTIHKSGYMLPKILPPGLQYKTLMICGSWNIIRLRLLTDIVKKILLSLR